MCLLLIAIDVVPGRPLLMLGNRDEFHARPSAAAAVWEDDASISGGRDRVAGGSWMALRRPARFAAVTNLRMRETRLAARSRGELIADFLRSELSPQAWLDGLRARRDDYAPFNLVVAVGIEVWCLQSPAARMAKLQAGIHVVSNGDLDENWPKMRRLRSSFENALLRPGWDDAALLDLLADRSTPTDAELPDTGVGLQLEKFLAPVFIVGNDYGTRTSSLASWSADGTLELRERSYIANGVATGEVSLSLPA